MPDNTAYKIKMGNYKAYNSLFKKYYLPLCNYASGIVNSDSEAEDIVQDVFINIWTNRAKLEIGLNLNNYLYTSIRNKCVSLLKKREYNQSYIDMQLKTVEDNVYDSNSVEYKELSTIVRKCMQELPERCGQIFKMSRFNDYKHQKISELLNISVNTIKVQISKALSLMRVCVESSY